MLLSRFRLLFPRWPKWCVLTLFIVLFSKLLFRGWIYRPHWETGKVYWLRRPISTSCLEHNLQWELLWYLRVESSLFPKSGESQPPGYNDGCIGWGGCHTCTIWRMFGETGLLQDHLRSSCVHFDTFMSRILQPINRWMGECHTHGCNSYSNFGL